MYPIVTVFGREVGIYGICAAVGFLAAAFAALLLARKRNIESADVILTLVAALVGMLLGSHILYGITRIGEIADTFARISELSFAQFCVNIGICFGGAVFYGGFLGGIVGVLAACRVINSEKFERFVTRAPESGGRKAGASGSEKEEAGASGSEKEEAGASGFEEKNVCAAAKESSDLEKSSHRAAPKRGFERGDMLDIYACCVPLFHAFGRVGCFFAGCCFGIESSLGFTVTGNIYNPDINGVRRFPVQLLESLVCLIIFGIMLLLFKRSEQKAGRICGENTGQWKNTGQRENAGQGGIFGQQENAVRKDSPETRAERGEDNAQEAGRGSPENHAFSGCLIFIYMLIYAPIRFLLEFLRGDEIRGFLGPFSTSQWISAALIAVGIIGFARARRRSRALLSNFSIIVLTE